MDPDIVVVVQLPVESHQISGDWASSHLQRINAINENEAE